MEIGAKVLEIDYLAAKFWQIQAGLRFHQGEKVTGTFISRMGIQVTLEY